MQKSACIAETST